MASEKAVLFCSKVEVYGNQFQACIWQYLCGWSGTFVASNKTAFVRYLDSRLTGRHCPKPLVQCQNINKPAGESSQHDVQPQGRFQSQFHKFWLESFSRWIKISVNLIYYVRKNTLKRSGIFEKLRWLELEYNYKKYYLITYSLAKGLVRLKCFLEDSWMVFRCSLSESTASSRYKHHLFYTEVPKSQKLFWKYCTITC